MQRTEANHFIDAVEEFRPELRRQAAVDLSFQCGCIAITGVAEDGAAGQVAGHHHHGVAEINAAALGVAEAAVIEHLQQQVEHLRVRLLDFIEQHHRIGPAPHRLGELASFLVAHVARWRPDQTGHGIALHELAHVEPHQSLFFIKKVGGQGASQLGFTHTGGAQEQKGAHRPTRIFHAGAGAADRRGHSRHGIGLAKHLLAEAVFQFEQFLPLTGHQALHRNAGGAGHHIGDVLGRHQIP